MTDKTIKYVGFVGERNIGDEAIYAASKELFPEYELVPFYEGTRSEIMLIGGGTMLPGAVTKNEYRGKDISDVSKAYAIGVGVQHPSYHNRKNGIVDVSHFLGQRDISLDDSLGILGPLKSWFRHLNTAMGDPLNITSSYITDSQYRQIETFGFNNLGVRGPHSRSVLRKKTGMAPDVVGDTALYLQPREYIDKDTYRMAICMRGPGGNWSDYGDNLDTLIQVCNSFADEYEFVLLPFYPPDRDIHEKLHREIDNSVMKNYYSDTDLSGLLDEIARTDLMIGEKLHASVLSACCHVPMVSLQYRMKNRDFMASIGLNELNVTPEDGTFTHLKDRFNYAISEPEVINEIRSSVSEFRMSLEDFANGISEDIDK